MSEMSGAEAPMPAMKEAIEAVQFEHEKNPMVMLRDVEGLSQNSIALTMPGFLLATMMDGRNTAADIQSAFAKATGNLLKVEEIQGLAAELDKAGLLETETLARRRTEVLEGFLKSPVRPAIHQGGGYPAESLELAAYMGKFFSDPNGPGKGVPSSPLRACPQALFAPHIDLERGGPAYAWAYQALAECTPPDLIVALGVAHASPPSPWVATRKRYATPHGDMEVDSALYDEFRDTLWYDPTDDEVVHRTEHSLEFQALWLKYLWREKTPKWLPILCSSFEMWANDQPPSTVGSVDGALLRFGQALKRRQDKGERILILAGVDLAHVGPRFGDDLELTPDLLDKVRREDRSSLDLAEAGDADGSYMSVVKDGHWRKWCGLSAIYSSLRLLKEMAPAAKGKTLTYGQAPDPMGGVVSFTSIIFPRVL